MSKLYPEMKKKPEKHKVICMLCEHLEPYDNGLNSWCPEKKKNIQPDEVTADRVCRDYDPKPIKKKEDPE